MKKPFSTNLSRRAWLASLLVMVLVCTLLWWTQTSNFRCIALKCLAFTYAVWDPLTQETTVDIGPPSARSMISSVRHEESRLAKWFPELTLRVSMTHRPLNAINTPVFQHEVIGAAQVEAFRLEAKPLLHGARDVFSLSSKVRGLSKHGVGSFDANGSDPLDFLRLAKQGQPLTCRPFALVFGHCAVVQGYTARLLGLSADGESFDHAVSEVYVPEFSKWIVIDPDFNIAYRRDGVWQNAAELHDIWQEIKAACRGTGNAKTVIRNHLRDRNIELVVLGPEGVELRSSNLEGIDDGIGLRYYNNVTYSTRNNYLSGSYPKGHPKGSFQYALVSELGSPLGICPEAATDSVRQKVYFPVGRSEIEIAGKVDDTAIEIRLGTWTPNFREFEVRIDNTEWKSQRQPVVIMHLSEGKHVCEVRSVNLAGLRGETAVIEIVAVKRMAATSDANAEEVPVHATGSGE